MSDMIIEGGSLQSSPEGLSSEALRPAEVNILDQLSRGGRAKARDVIDGTYTRVEPPPRRGPGRPRKEETPQDQVAAKLVQKKAKAAKYTDQILTDLNDELFSGLMSMGLPSAILYKEGKAPIAVVDSKYTDFGNRIAIKPSQARHLGAFVAELETTDIGSKFAGTTSNSSLGLLLKGGLAAFAVISYIQGIRQLMSEPQMQQLMAVVQANKERERNAGPDDR